MRSTDHDHDSLLSDLFEGPDVDAVVKTIRREKAAAKTRRRMAVGGTITALAVVACFFSLAGKPGEIRTVLQASTAREDAAAEVTETPSLPELPAGPINDEQLMALLKGHPAALVHLPSGKQQLLLVDDPHQGEDVSIISL